MTLRNAAHEAFPTDSYADSSETFVYSQGKWHILGDANGDRRVSIADANMVKTHISGIATPTLSPAAADIDGNGKLDQDDIDGIVQKYLE